VIFGTGVFVLGIAVIVMGFLLPKTFVKEGFNTLFSIGGAFVSSLSGFQLKEVLQYKEKVGVLEAVRLRVQLLNKEENKSNGELAHIQEIVWKLIEKTAIG
jgi:hypothetical protein